VIVTISRHWATYILTGQYAQCGQYGKGQWGRNKAGPTMGQWGVMRGIQPWHRDEKC
jgi:hypothetical protein